MYKDVDLSSHFRFKTIYSVFKDKISSDYFFSGERHKMWEVVIATKGRLGVVADTNAFILNKGQAILHEPWEFHRLWSEGSEAEFIIFTFTAENMPNYTSKIFEIEDTEKIDVLINELRSVYAIKGLSITHPNENCEIKCQIAIKKLEGFFLKQYFKSQ